MAKEKQRRRTLAKVLLVMVIIGGLAGCARTSTPRPTYSPSSQTETEETGLDIMEDTGLSEFETVEG
jgi:ABC-type uncharacterized transport system auxiliary subunit